MSGVELCQMTEEDMLSMAPPCGDILHSRLHVWMSGESMSHANISNDSIVDCVLERRAVVELDLFAQFRLKLTTRI